MQNPNDTAPRTKKPWTPPTIETLPPLTELTLQTGGIIPGDGGVF